MSAEMGVNLRDMLPLGIAEIPSAKLDAREWKRLCSVAVLHRETAARLLTALHARKEVDESRATYNSIFDDLPLGLPYYTESFLNQYRELLPDVAERGRIIALLDHFKLTASQYASILFMSMGFDNKEMTLICGGGIAQTGVKITKKLQRGLLEADINDIRVNNRDAVAYVAVGVGMIPKVISESLVGCESVDIGMQRLTDKQRDLLPKVLTGASYTSIAEEIEGGKPELVQGMADRILVNLGCRDRAQLPLFYFAWVEWKEQQIAKDLA